MRAVAAAGGEGSEVEEKVHHDSAESDSELSEDEESGINDDLARFVSRYRDIEQGNIRLNRHVADLVRERKSLEAQLKGVREEAELLANSIQGDESSRKLRLDTLGRGVERRERAAHEMEARTTCLSTELLRVAEILRSALDRLIRRASRAGIEREQLIVPTVAVLAPLMRALAEAHGQGSFLLQPLN